MTELNKIWTWQPGDPSTGMPDMRGPLVIYGSVEEYAANLPAETQHTISYYEKKLDELRSELYELKRKNRIVELLKELNGLGWEENY